MPNKNYVNGRAFEYRVKKYMEKQGFYVMRSASSKGPFDLLAINQYVVYGIQCKANGKVSQKELEEIRKAIRGRPIIGVIASRPMHFEFVKVNE
mgnify:CR=1 FL=1